MFKRKSTRKMPLKVFTCFMGLVLAMGISVPSTLVAYAADAHSSDDASSQDGSLGAGIVASTIDAQDGVEQNYAVLDDSGTLTFYYGVRPETVGNYYGGYDTETYTLSNQVPWSSKASEIKKVTFDSSVQTHLAPKSTAFWFAYLYKCEAIEGLGYLDTSHVTTMANMFKEFGRSAQSPLTTLDLSSFDTGNVTNMSRMFYDANRLTSIRFGTSFGTANVTDMSEMFAHCTQLTSTTSLPGLSSFTTTSLTNMSGMFNGCSALATIDLSNFNTSNVTDMSSLFFNCTSLTSVDMTGWSSNSLTSMEAMFTGCRSLTILNFPDSGFSAANVTNMARMFQSCSALTAPDISGFNTSKVTTFRQMFDGCSALTTLSLANFSTSAATDLSYLFFGCSELESITFGDSFTVSNATTLSSMFGNCKSLTNLTSTFDKWDTSKVTNMSNMFYYCTALTTLDLSSFNTSAVTTFQGMFSNCGKLNSVTFGANFNCKGAGITYSQYWATLPTPPATSLNDGKWNKSESELSCTPAEIQELSADGIAGTWTWTPGISVEVTSTKGGTATAEKEMGNTGDTTVLTATPDEGYTFNCWVLMSGEGTGSISATGEASASYTFGSANGRVKAVFKKTDHAYGLTPGALSATSFTYNGQVQVPAFTVRDSDSHEILAENVDYTVSYEQGSTQVTSPTEAGTYKVYVTGAANYSAVPKSEVGEFTINPSITVSGTLACASGWEPDGTTYANWGTLVVKKPREGSGYDYAATLWPTESAFTLNYIEPGSQIVFTPQNASNCGPYTYIVPSNQTENITNVTLTASYTSGTVRFKSVELVTTDRLYDPDTGADYTKDDAEAARAEQLSLITNGARVKATNLTTGKDVPVSKVDGQSIVINDVAANLVEGAKYKLTISLRDPVFAVGYFTSDPYAATAEVEVTLGNVGSGSNGVGASDVQVKAYSRGRAVIHYANPSATRTALFLYDGSGDFVGEATISNKGNGVVSTGFMSAGNYTLCAVPRDVYGSLAKTGSGTAKAPSTLTELRSFDFAQGQLVEQTFTVQDNKLTDVGVRSPLMFPASTASDLVDRAHSSVTATSSYSSYTTITVVVALNDAADAQSLGVQANSPKLRIYTNQNQKVKVNVSGSSGRTQYWPQSLSINGKPVTFNDTTFPDWAMMLDGWIDLDLFKVCPDYKGAESFPMTVSLTVPRSDPSRTQASAYLQLPGVSNFVGSFDQAPEELSLVVPETVATKTFTAQGYTAANASVALSIDGVEAASTSADEYGYYAAKLTLPEDTQDPTTFDVQASASWSVESVQYSASSDVLDVTYSTTKASLKRLWMLTQHGQNGAWDYVLAYDDGAWSSMYKGYYLGGSWANRRFIWIAEFNNAEYAENVKCIVPRSEGDLSLPMTRDLSVADGWLSLTSPGSSWYAMPDTISTQSLGAQSLVEFDGLAAMGARGTLDYRKGAEIIKGYLQSGNAFVSEPVNLSLAPSGVYVTYDDVERQTLAQSDAYTGYSGADQADVAKLIAAINKGSNMLIVEKDLDANGNLQKVDAATEAEKRVNATAGQVDEWIAVSASGADASTLDYSNWLHLHHTVATSAIADMSEPLGMITSAKAKYAEFKKNIRDAVAKGGSADDAVTLCPCKIEPTTQVAGVPIVDMTVSADDDLQSLRYFIWAEDSKGNSYVRTMERYDVVGGYEAYRQYEADEKKLVITEWNMQTGQKTILTYEIADTFVNALSGGQHDTDFEFLMNLWSLVGGRVQLGLSDAVDVLATDAANGTLATQAIEALGAIGAQEAGSQAESQPALAVQQIVSRNWLDWKQDALEASGLVADWGELKNDELKSLYKFIWDNKSSCLEIECKIQKSNSDDFGDPYGAAKAAAFRGGLKRVYDIVEFSTAFGQKFYDSGVAGAVKDAAEGYFRNKTQEGFRNFVWGQKHASFEDSVLSKYSNEYKRIVQQLFDLQERMYANGNPNGIPANCIDWSAIPDDLYYTIKYLKQQHGNEYAQHLYSDRARDNGSIWPKAKHDPSGIVYEGMLSNPVEGATVTLYTYNENSANADHAVIVDSEKFGYEPNPQVTGSDGRYQWFVGEGYWQVRVAMDGYSSVSTGSSDKYGIGATKDLNGDGTDEATTYWMPVLPEQIDVNIPLRSTAAPVVESVEGTAKGVLVTFSKPLKVDTVSAGMFTLQVDSAGNAQVCAGIEPVGADVAADDSSQKLARTFLVKYPDNAVLAIGTHTASVAFSNNGDAAKSYAGTAATNAAEQSYNFTVSNELTVQAVSGTFTYNGKAQAPNVVVRDAVDDTKALKAGTDYALSYKKDGEAVESPTDVGTYLVSVTGAGAYAEVREIAAGSFTIVQRPVVVTAADQTVFVKEAVSNDASQATLSGAADGHSLGAVTLEANTSEVTATGLVRPIAALVRDGGGQNVTSNYSFTYMDGTLTVTDHWTVTFDSNGGSSVAAQSVGNGKQASKPARPTRSGYTFGEWQLNGKAYDFSTPVTGDITLKATWKKASSPDTKPDDNQGSGDSDKDSKSESSPTPGPEVEPTPSPVVKIEMRRLYNPYSYEHFYTSDQTEFEGLVELGWVDEGLGWVAPETSDIPVYRLYNPYNGGDHHYTKDAAERDALVAVGWVDEGTGWYSAGDTGTPVYREYNPFEIVRNHNYTTNKEEHDGLVAIGWHDEDIAWYGVGE